MPKDGRAERVKAALAGMASAYNAGSPVARPDEEVATLAVRRWESFARRNPVLSRPEREARIKDLGLGLAGQFSERSQIGPLIRDYEFTAAQICDSLCFILPAGSSGWSAGPDHAATQRGVEALHIIAKQNGLTVVESQSAHENNSYVAHQLVGWGPLWVLFHRAVPIFAFAVQLPEPGSADTIALVDAPMDVGSLISPDWRYLSPALAQQPLDAEHLVDLNDADREVVSQREPATLGELLFRTRC